MPLQDQKISFVLQELTRRSEDILKRLREMEQRLNTLEERFSVVEELDIERNKKNDQRFTELTVGLDSANNEMIKLKLLLEKINKQTDKFARKSEIKGIEAALGILKPDAAKEEEAEV